MEVLREIRSQARLRIEPRGTSIVILLLIGLKSQLVIPTLCPFRVIVNLPCPFCGITSALNAVLLLDFRKGFELHPLVVIPIFYLVHAVIRNRFWMWPTVGAEKIAVLGAFLGVWLVRITGF